MGFSSQTVQLLVVSPDPNDATSFYRAIGPLAALRARVPGLTLSFFAGVPSWATMAMTDVIFLQRPYATAHLELAQAAQEHGRKVWIDYDDDLFTVPPGNPAHALYSEPSIQANIASLIRMADAVTVSTAPLKAKLEEGGLLRRDRRPCVVVPNAFNDTLFPARKAPAPREKTIVWRGSVTHRPDLIAFRPAIVASARKHPDFRWHFIGDDPPFMRDAGLPNAAFLPGLPPLAYFRSLADQRPTVLVVPLQDCEFNHAKSNIAWIEGAFAGAVVLAPDWEEWRRPGCITYADETDFGHQLDRILAGDVDVVDDNARAWAYIERHLKLTEVNALRADVLERLRPAR